MTPQMSSLVATDMDLNRPASYVAEVYARELGERGDADLPRNLTHFGRRFLLMLGGHSTEHAMCWCQPRAEHVACTGLGEDHIGEPVHYLIVHDARVH